MSLKHTIIFLVLVSTSLSGSSSSSSSKKKGKKTAPIPYVHQPDFRLKTAFDIRKFGKPTTSGKEYYDQRRDGIKALWNETLRYNKAGLVHADKIATWLKFHDQIPMMDLEWICHGWNDALRNELKNFLQNYDYSNAPDGLIVKMTHMSYANIGNGVNLVTKDIAANDDKLNEKLDNLLEENFTSQGYNKWREKFNSYDYNGWPGVIVQKCWKPYAGFEGAKWTPEIRVIFIWGRLFGMYIHSKLINDNAVVWQPEHLKDGIQFNWKGGKCSVDYMDTDLKECNFIMNAVNWEKAFPKMKKVINEVGYEYGRVDIFPKENQPEEWVMNEYEAEFKKDGVHDIYGQALVDGWNDENNFKNLNDDFFTYRPENFPWEQFQKDFSGPYAPENVGVLKKENFSFPRKRV